MERKKKVRAYYVVKRCNHGFAFSISDSAKLTEPKLYLMVKTIIQWKVRGE